MIEPDPIVNPLDFDNPVDTQVAVGSEVTDESGTRRETLIVLPGTQATMVMPGRHDRTHDDLECPSDRIHGWRDRPGGDASGASATDRVHVCHGVHS